jgi:NADH:ubiquinone oxidoreductase subunit F (NADH-binding)
LLVIGNVQVHVGPLLLARVGDGPSLTSHRARLGPAARPGLAALIQACEAVALQGRGGAGFPFATKLRAAARLRAVTRSDLRAVTRSDLRAVTRRRAVVVVNAAEGEPASAKDRALMVRAPHLVLDGAAAAAHALGAKEVHVVVPAAWPAVGQALRTALSERRAAAEPLRWKEHTAQDWFVAGQARAVLELLGGRENLPVTAWQPEAVRGLGGRPTLLSNAETFAQVAAIARLGPQAYARHGWPGSPGTVLLTVGGDGPAPYVLEVPGGSPLRDALPGARSTQCPVLLGGYHGAWLTTTDVASATLDRVGLRAAGFTLGAGVVLPLGHDECPVQRTAGIVKYLAGQSAGRCGPCRFGLPALADELDRLALGQDTTTRLRELTGLVTGRGACAHPDGTARLVASLMSAFPDEVTRHVNGRCGWPTPYRTGAAS